jgi:hypothetical protein
MSSTCQGQEGYQLFKTGDDWPKPCEDFVVSVAVITFSLWFLVGCRMRDQKRNPLLARRREMKGGIVILGRATLPVTILRQVVNATHISHKNRGPDNTKKPCSAT